MPGKLVRDKCSKCRAAAAAGDADGGVMRGGGAIQFCVGTLFRFQVFGRLLGTHLSIGSEFVHSPEFVHNGEKNTVTQNPFFGSNDFSSVTEHP